MLRHNGDIYDRYMIRIDEMRAVARHDRAGLDGLPEGPWIADDRKVVLPPRHELHTSMESLIHHFKLVTEGFRVPAGEVYVGRRGAARRARLQPGVRWHRRPWRVHFRSASLVMLQSVAPLTKGVLIADLIAILASLDPNMGDCDR